MPYLCAPLAVLLCNSIYMFLNDVDLCNCFVSICFNGVYASLFYHAPNIFFLLIEIAKYFFHEKISHYYSSISILDLLVCLFAHLARLFVCLSHYFVSLQLLGGNCPIASSSIVCCLFVLDCLVGFLCVCLFGLSCYNTTTITITTATITTTTTTLQLQLIYL